MIAQRACYLIAPRIPPGRGRSGVRGDGSKAEWREGPRAAVREGERGETGGPRHYGQATAGQGPKGSGAQGPHGARNEAQGAPDRAQDRPKVAPGGALGPVRPSGLPALGPQGSLGALSGALSGARSTTRILRFGGGSGLPRQASLGRDPRLESCDLGRAQIALSSIGLRCSRHKMRNPLRQNTTFSDLAGALH